MKIRGFFVYSLKSCSAFIINSICLDLSPPFIYKPVEREMKMVGKEGETKSGNVVKCIQLTPAQGDLTDLLSLFYSILVS